MHTLTLAYCSVGNTHGRAREVFATGYARTQPSGHSARLGVDPKSSWRRWRALAETLPAGQHEEPVAFMYNSAGGLQLVMPTVVVQCVMFLNTVQSSNGNEKWQSVGQSEADVMEVSQMASVFALQSLAPKAWFSHLVPVASHFNDRAG